MENGIFQLQALRQDPGLWWSSRVGCKLRGSFLGSCGRTSTQTVPQLVMSSSSEWAKAPLISSIPRLHSSYSALPAPFIAPFTTKDSLLISLAMLWDKLDGNRDSAKVLQEAGLHPCVAHLQHSSVLVTLFFRTTYCIWYNYYVILV